jgi:hypothetical protein
MKASLGAGAVMLMALVSFPASAQKAPDKATDKTVDKPAERMERVLSEPAPGLKSKVLDVKNRAPEDLIRVLRHLSSGVKGTSIAESGEFRTIAVRDFPENILAIEEALRKLDVAVAPKPDVELKIRVLIAGPNGTGTEALGDLQPVVKQLRATLSYKGYFQIASISQRVKAGSGSWGKGVMQVSPPAFGEPATIPYSYAFETVTLDRRAGGRPVILVKALKFATGNNALGEADIHTGLTIREGEKVVVGTASLKDRALILVLSGRIVN